MGNVIADRIADPIMLIITLGLFFSSWALFPRLGPLGCAVLASLISTVAFATFVAGEVPNLPQEADVFFARFISALIQCILGVGVIWAWRQLRS
jgi:hypothetical protein